jgi:hypothetical protein
LVCFKFARQDIKVESTNGTIVEDGSVDKMMTFITEVQNIVNDTSIPRPIRNKLFNDMQSDTVSFLIDFDNCRFTTIS